MKSEVLGDRSSSEHQTSEIRVSLEKQVKIKYSYASSNLGKY